MAADNTVIEIWKRVGETPLEALERWRSAEVASGRVELAGVPMTYAGRLDPMAEGVLLVLVGDECKRKGEYLGLDKEYEVEVVFGLTTDTYDALGVVGSTKSGPSQHVPGGGTYANVTTFSSLLHRDLAEYVGRFAQEYPPYSSKAVGGRQLHELARAGELPDDMPTRDVEIYAIEKIAERQISAEQLKKEILDKIGLVKGDFRQEEITARWEEALLGDIGPFPAMTIRVKCSSGTYMRSLAHRMGQDAGTGAFALSIKRTKIFTPSSLSRDRARSDTSCGGGH